MTEPLRSAAGSPTFYPCLNAHGEAWLRHTGEAIKRHAPRGQVLLAAGDEVKGLYFLYQGLLKYSIFTPEGDVKTVGIIQPTTVVGEGPLFLERPCLITVEAIEPSDYYYFPGELVHRLVRTDPDIALSVITNMAGKIRMLLRQISDLQFHDLRTRLASLLFVLACGYGDPNEDGIAVSLRLSHEELAALVGGSRSTVTTILGEMRDEGLIDIGTRRVEVLDMRALCRAARPARLAGEPVSCGTCSCDNCPKDQPANA